MSISSGLGSVIGGTVSGLSGLAGSLFGGMSSANATAQSDQENAAIAKYNDDRSWDAMIQTEGFQNQEASSVYSRGVQDMRNAGLNPLMAAGSPDPSASGGSFSTSQPNIIPTINPQTFAGIGNVGSNFISGYNTVNSAFNQNAQTDSSVALNSALQAKAAADTASSQANAAKTIADTNKSIASLPNTQLANSAAAAISPLVNSAVSAGQSASTKLSNAFSNIYNSASDAVSNFTKQSPTLTRFGQIMQELVSPSGTYSGSQIPKVNSSQLQPPPGAPAFPSQ